MVLVLGYWVKQIHGRVVYRTSSQLILQLKPRRVPQSSKKVFHWCNVGVLSGINGYFPGQQPIGVISPLDAALHPQVLRTMLTRTLTLLFTLLLCTCVHAQTVPDKAKKRAKERTERKAEDNMNQKIDKAVDDAFDAVGSLFKRKKKKSKTEDRPEDGQRAPDDSEEYDEDATRALSNLFGGSSDFEPFTNEHSFSLVMDMTSTNRRGKTEEVTMQLAVAPTQIGQLIVTKDKGKTAEFRSVFDTQSGKTTLVTEQDGELSAVRMRMPNLSGLMENMDTDLDEQMGDLDIQRTGETKVIDGYTTHKFIVRDDSEGYTTESWVTFDLDLDAEAMYRGMTAAMGMGKGFTMPSTPQGLENGVAIMSTYTDDKGETVTMHYREIKVGEGAMDASVLDLGGIPVQEVPGF